MIMKKTSILIRRAAVCLLVFLASCIKVENQVTSEFTDAPDLNQPDEFLVTPQSENPYFEAGGIRLSYDPGIGDYLEDYGEVISAENGEQAYSTAHPDLVHFSLKGIQADVYIVETASYESSADFAGETIKELKRFISAPDMAVKCIPELPMDAFYHECGHQQFNAHMAPVKFGNGSGVRFVSVYAIQNMAPVDNENLVYVFQGFTNDGKYFLKVIARLSSEQLEDKGEIPAEIYTAMDAKTLDAYFNEFAELLNRPDSVFIPGLEWLDSLIGHLSVS